MKHQTKEQNDQSILKFVLFPRLHYFKGNNISDRDKAIFLCGMSNIDVHVFLFSLDCLIHVLMHFFFQ